MRFHCKSLVAVACLLCTSSSLAQEETIFMSILSSRKHRLAASDNPLVGLFVSTDRGGTWRHEGWKEYIRVFYSEGGPDSVLWSACGNGVLRSTDHGASWRVTTGWDVTEVLKVKVNPLHPVTVAAATAYGVIVTTDGGTHWRTQSSGMRRPFASDVLWIGDKTLLAASEEGVFRSTDNGAHWRPSGLHHVGIRVIVESASTVKHLWVGTEDKGVFCSSDGGATWRARSNGLAHPTVYALAVDPIDRRTLYAGTFGGGVYTSTDEGRSWRQTSSGLTTLDVHALLVLPSQPSVLFAGTLNGGLFRSTDRGKSWQFNSQEDAQVWGLYAGRMP